MKAKLKKKAKYNNIKVFNLGLNRMMDSKAENERANELLLLQCAGKIRDLKAQPKFELLPKFVYKGKKVLAVTYTADFEYYDCELKIWIVEDVKSTHTAEKESYILRSKMLMNLLKDNEDKEFREVIK